MLTKPDRRPRPGVKIAQSDRTARMTAIVRREMERAGVSYRDLAERLNALGDKAARRETVTNKINLGKFDGIFLLRVCDALDVTTLQLD
jgi:hypothetical protein